MPCKGWQWHNLICLHFSTRLTKGGKESVDSLPRLIRIPLFMGLDNVVGNAIQVLPLVIHQGVFIRTLKLHSHFLASRYVKPVTSWQVWSVQCMSIRLRYRCIWVRGHTFTAPDSLFPHAYGMNGTLTLVMLSPGSNELLHLLLGKYQHPGRVGEEVFLRRCW